MKKTYAPWTVAQVKILTKRQEDNNKYICVFCDFILEPTIYGWTCREHGLVQKWAHYIDLVGK